jgi:transposase
MPNKKDGAKRYTEAQKRHILETAKREGLSGPQAAKRFKVNLITFYRWRGPVRGRKAGAGRRGRPPP